MRRFRKAPYGKKRSMLRRAIFVVVVVLLLAACGAPSPTDSSGSASPEKGRDNPPASLIASPEVVARATIDAWGRNDRHMVDLLTAPAATTELLGRPFPQPSPALTSCGPDLRVSGGQTCVFNSGSQHFTFLIQPRPRGGWEVTAARFLA